MTTSTHFHQKMPAIFLGHGSPMNALSENAATQAMRRLGQRLPRPKGLLMISAHWMTQGTWVTHMLKPKTIHDFYGFPQELFNVQYPAPGKPDLADHIRHIVSNPIILADDSKWGLDHGAWSVLVHLYPKADVPVVQLSLDMTKPAEFHFELGKKLHELRNEGILIIGSGNIVHNLRKISWETDAEPFDWAIEFDSWVKEQAKARNFTALVSEALQSEAGRLSIPTPDHYYPLLYILGAAAGNDELTFDIEEIQNGSISMRSLRFGCEVPH